MRFRSAYNERSWAIGLIVHLKQTRSAPVELVNREGE